MMTMSKLKISFGRFYSLLCPMQLLLFIVLITLLSMGNLYAQDGADQLRDVEVKIYLIDIDGVDNVEQSFMANLTLVMQWHDPEQAHQGPDSIEKNLKDIWHPRLQILNQQRLVKTFPESVEVRPDGQVIHRQRLWGSFSQPLNLRDFPFDKQRLEVQVGNISFGTQKISLSASPDSGISDNLTIPDWKILQWDFAAKELKFDNEMSPLPGMVFSMEVERDTNYFKYKVILPLILIVMMSWLVFWIDASLTGSQISVAVTAMLTMIAYRFALAGMIPRLPFLTTMDFFVIASTIMVFLAMVEVVYTTYLATNDRIDQARKIDHKARWIAPLVYLVLIIETLFIRLWV